ncbi:MAG: rod shape-determining protein MreC [Thermanaerothrix sp.]|jgi:rod shape-determining protein MreC|uniref:Cell shape-determining protein MreC n=1 Tax=Thermanaerothrix solaris TaxID=3058434 RepID=A0ABU3NQP0_9CHLR|nr:rod shape-determining protein MreC [Thermanaerothrix sp. 4228-RoL]MDT8899158.1 rod shape-determining protein MreC [Thermanaerothrix sp. 4228-RoL]
MKALVSRFWQTAFVLIVAGGLILLALSGYLQPLLRSVMSPLVGVQQWISSRYIAAYQFLTAPRDMAALQQRNFELEQQVAELQAQVIELQQQLREAQVIYALLDFARSHPQNQYVAANVIGRDPSPFLHYIIIDRGSDDGIRHGMPVVTNLGLVGRIDAVTAGAARVQLITDPSAVVNVRLQSSKVEGQTHGSVTGEISLEMIPQDTVIQVGDLVLTSGLGGTYPPDILVGQVSDVRKQPNQLFQTAVVQPVVDFTALQAVLVITNFRPVQIAPLIPTPIP